MIPQDYHVHTRFSCDSHATMTEMCRAALELGIPEIGFCDHFDPLPEDPCYGYFDAEAWWKAFEACQAEFKDLLQIRAGIELGEPHRFPEDTGSILRKFPWDFVIGSVHWVGASLIFHRSYFRQPADVAYQSYFEELYRLVTQADFDILAHFDIVKRYGFDEYGEFNPLGFETEIRNVLRVCAQRDIALEVNTSTLRRPVHQPSPSADILSWFLDEGGKWITLGSDAHQPEHVGAELETALSIVQSTGFEHLASYEARQPARVNFPKEEQLS